MNSDISEEQAPSAPPATPATNTSNVGNSSYSQPGINRSVSASYFISNSKKIQANLSASTITSNDILQSSELQFSNNYEGRRPHESYVWEMHTRSPNLTPASTVLNSPDLNTDAHYSMDPHGRQQIHQHHQIRLGRSPVGQFEQLNKLSQDLNSPGSPTDVGKSGAQCLRDGEIVVFDDIDTNWMNKANNTLHQDADVHVTAQNDDILKVTKMIGQLPIAEYEGSPRRFGNNQLTTEKHNSKSYVAFQKRPPGFPLRVSSHSGAQQQQDVRQHIVDAVANDNKLSENIIVGNLSDIACDDSDRNGCKFLSSSTATDTHGRPKTPTFDYLYEFSETRKVLEEFFKGANAEDEQRYSEFTESDDLGSSGIQCELEDNKIMERAYVGQRLARTPKEELCSVHRSPRKQPSDNVYNEHNDIELFIDSNSRSSEDLADTELETNLRRHSRNFTLSPETTDYDSNCGDLDSLSNDINCPTDFGKLYTSMPVLEDGLSSGHASDTENNVVGEICALSDNTHERDALQTNMKQLQVLQQIEYHADASNDCYENCGVAKDQAADANLISDLIDVSDDLSQRSQQQQINCSDFINIGNSCCDLTQNVTHSILPAVNYSSYEPVYATVQNIKHSPASPPPSSPTHHQHRSTARAKQESSDIQEAMNDIRSALQRAKTQPEKLKFCDEVLPADPESPIWVPRKITTSPCEIINQKAGDEEEADTDLETDRLLGQQRLDEVGYFEEKTIWPKTSHIDDSNEPSPTTSDVTMLTNSTTNNVAINSVVGSSKPTTFSSATIRQGIGTSLTPTSPERCQVIGAAEINLSSPVKLQYSKSPTGSIKSLKDSTNSDKKAKSRNKEGLLEPAVLIEGVLFRARYLGSTQLVCEGQPTKSTRMMQAEEAVSRIKAPEGESQPSTEVDLFISTEKIMVLNTDLKEIMMDHALRTISYIADIGDLVVLMARRRFVPSDTSLSDNADNNGYGSNNNNNSSNSNGCNAVTGSSSSSIGSNNPKPNRTPKMICHVFESDEAQFIAQSIGQAFQVAYMEFLKANGIEDHSFVKEMDYQEVLNSQEIFGDELEVFAKKELQKEVVVPKSKGEILGVVIVESGWGSMLPTVVIANLMSTGAAARCGQLNIGDQLIAINGMSLVGLPLSTCQSYIRNAKNQTAVKFTVVPCAPVVEVKIKRPNTKYQLGFSVQNGVICSLLRGGIAERGGVRVGHRIIEINNQSVVAVPHEKIVNLLATSVGEILMKTMPTSMFRLLTGQENPIYI